MNRSYFSVSASQSTWARPAVRSAMPAGSCTASSTASSLTAPCPATRAWAQVSEGSGYMARGEFMTLQCHIQQSAEHTIELNLLALVDA